MAAGLAVVAPILQYLSIAKWDYYRRPEQMPY
jgi:hypothetical protein